MAQSDRSAFCVFDHPATGWLGGSDVSIARIGRLSVAADARIDDRRNLCTALGLQPAEAPAGATLIAHAWHRWGAGALDTLLGDFAFALFDDRDGSLHLARDVLGRRPLHFRHEGGRLTLASLPHVLVASGDRTRVDLDTLARYHAMLPQTGPESFFAGVQRVEPGSIVSWRPSGSSVRRYWTPPRPINPIGIAEAIEETRRLLELAVADRLEPGVPVGIQLSGGMDSSAVAAAVGDIGVSAIAVTSVASAQADPPPPGYQPEDGRIAALTAARYRTIDHRLCDTACRPWTELLTDWNAAVDQPIRSLENADWVAATGHIAADGGATTMLSGDFGNNSLSYDGTALFADLLRSGKWLALARESAAFRRVSGARRRGVASYALGPFFPAPLWRAASHGLSPAARLSESSMFKPGHPVIRYLLDRARADGYDLSGRPPRSCWHARAGELRWVDNSLLGKAIAERTGVTLTDPTADRRLVEFTLSLPACHWLRAGRTRALARHLLDGRVPDEVVNPPGRGFQGADWRASAEPAIAGLRDEVGRLRQTEFGEMLDLDRMDQLLRDWPRTGWSDFAQQHRYRFSLLHAIGAGHYARTRSEHAEAT